MRNLKNISLILLIAIVSSCAKESDKDTSVVTEDIVKIPPREYGILPDSPDSSDLFTKDGSTVEFFPVNEDVFAEYAGRPLNNPSRYYITVNVHKMFDKPEEEVAESRSKYFGGTMRLSYFDDGSYHKGSQLVSTDKEKPLRDSFFQLKPNNEPEYYRGYYTDTSGALILVVNDFFDAGDGIGVEDPVSGEVWFYNFDHPNTSNPTSLQSPSVCWEILDIKGGPTPMHGIYGCRSHFNGSTPTTLDNPDHPTRAYKKLGTFRGLSLKSAFNLDWYNK